MRCSIVPSSPTLTAAPPTTVHAALGRSSRVVPSVRGECSHRARGGEHAAETETVGRGLKGQRQPHDVTYRTAPACVACTKARGSTVTISGNTVMIAMATTGDAERGGFGGGGVARHDHPDHQHDQQRAGDELARLCTPVAAEVTIPVTMLVAKACGISDPCTTVGTAPISSAMREVIGEPARNFMPRMSAAELTAVFAKKAWLGQATA
jgi:hypothetical protein